ncbi:MAG: MSCRAMM family protein [Planctomycetota bacterium]|jgi:hypothetical protein
MPAGPRSRASIAPDRKPWILGTVGAIGLLLIYLGLSSTPSAPTTTLEQEASAPVSEEAAPPAELGEVAEDGALDLDPDLPTENDPASAEARPTGSILGRVLDTERGPIPVDLIVVVAPSRMLIGDDAPIERRVGVDTDGRFDVRELPLAGYTVHAEWVGGRTGLVPVLLHAERSEVRVDLILERYAAVHGQVLDADGVAVASIDVQLAEPDAIPRGLPVGRTTRTDTAGRFHFDHVPSGDYSLLVGPPTAPAIEPIAVHVELSDIQLPGIEVPQLATLEIVVTDEFGTILPGVAINGFGSEGGVIRGTSDDFGCFDATLLPPGDYRLRANDDRFGRGHATIRVLPESQRLEATLVLRP